MEQAFRDETAHLRTLSSEEAFRWLVAHHPDLPRAIAHLSWKPREQVALLRHYARGTLPLTSQRGYDWLIRATAVSRFIAHVRSQIADMSPERLDLLLYCPRPALRDARVTARQKVEAADLIAEVKRLLRR
jgi:hypothetical protein